MDDDDYGADNDLIAALEASVSAPPRSTIVPTPFTRAVQQPLPQRLDRPPPGHANANAPGSKPVVQQPTPQALPARGLGSSILVSPRQKGNPVLACLKSMPWEYSDIPADYILGSTTCALFLSLKYHRLHPEYIYTRVRNLQGKYNLRILLTMVDIPNHEDCLRELAKTSLVNNVTVILCWSAAEAARYLELYKSYEHASFAALRGQQATGYAERLVEFVTVPRAINKSDAVALVSAFGSLRNAINADDDRIAVVGGWGEKKVKAWRRAVDAPFRARTAAKRTAAGKGKRKGMGKEKEPTQGPGGASALDIAVAIGTVPLRNMQSMGGQNGQAVSPGLDEDNEEAMLAAAIEGSKRTEQPSQQVSRSAAAPSGGAREDEDLPAGVAAALAKLRDKG